SGDFNQESADNRTVKTFCETNFGVDFPMAGLAHVRGAQAAPFYAWVREQKRWEPNWNFNKVLIGRDGRVAGTFGSGDEPDGPKLRQAIDAALGRAERTHTPSHCEFCAGRLGGPALDETAVLSCHPRG